ncbi:hypothetical protein QE390_001614 [Siphonobacter sp. SORGH_AS 1065]|nr:hypothetical protein [Siphonobacter sp. SORGH_AS_1065]
MPMHNPGFALPFLRIAFNIQTPFSMKKSLLVLAVALLGLTSCKDQCHQTNVSRNLISKQISTADLRNNGVAIAGAKSLEKPGKIYVKGSYLFINEIKKGIHIIDNSDPNNPKNLSFLSILGNADMAVKGNMLYADSYTDFLVFDLSDPTQPKLLKRIENAFTSGMVEGVSWFSNANGMNPAMAPTQITDYDVELITSVIETDCEGNMNPWSNPWLVFDSFFNASSSFSASLSSSSSPNQGSGTGGSMARFAIVNNTLYAVTNQNMQLFDISQPQNPQKGNVVTLGWGIETIFPYQDRLYVGSTTGVHILSNADPNNPVRVATLSHVRACDPVVVHENHAYVTLRQQTICGGSPSNQLDLIDVKDMYDPKLLKSFPMEGPYGLGVDHPTLFVCEGSHGLKMFDVSNPLELDKHLLNHFKNMDAYDVIPLSTKLLLLIGKDGFYQYDYTDRNNPRLLSKIPVTRPEA